MASSEEPLPLASTRPSSSPTALTEASLEDFDLAFFGEWSLDLATSLGLQSLRPLLMLRSRARTRHLTHAPYEPESGATPGPSAHPKESSAEQLLVARMAARARPEGPNSALYKPMCFRATVAASRTSTPKPRAAQPFPERSCGAENAFRTASEELDGLVGRADHASGGAWVDGAGAQWGFGACCFQNSSGSLGAWCRSAAGHQSSKAGSGTCRGCAEQ